MICLCLYWPCSCAEPKDPEAIRRLVGAIDFALTIEHDRAERFRLALERIRTMNGRGASDRARAESVRALHSRAVRMLAPEGGL